MIIFGGDFWQRISIFEFLHFLTNLDSAWLRQSPLVNSLQHRFFQFHLQISTFQDPRQQFNPTTQKKRNLVSYILNFWALLYRLKQRLYMKHHERRFASAGYWINIWSKWDKNLGQDLLYPTLGLLYDNDWSRSDLSRLEVSLF